MILLILILVVALVLLMWASRDDRTQAPTPVVEGPSGPRLNLVHVHVPAQAKRGRRYAVEWPGGSGGSGGYPDPKPPPRSAEPAGVTP